MVMRANVIRMSFGMNPVRPQPATLKLILRWSRFGQPAFEDNRKLRVRF